MKFRFRLQPTTRKRLQRFRRTTRAWVSFWILLGIFLLSLVVDFIANDKPLILGFDGKLYFPIFAFIPEDTFTGSGRMTRPDYKEIAGSEVFASTWKNWMIFPPIRFGQAEKIKPEDIDVPDGVTVVFQKRPRVASINLAPDGTIARSVGAGPFFGVDSDRELQGKSLGDAFKFPAAALEVIERRLANEASPALTMPSGVKGVDLAFSAYRPRSRPPTSVRLSLRDAADGSDAKDKLSFQRDLQPAEPSAFWNSIPPAEQERILLGVQKQFVADLDSDIAPLSFGMSDGNYQARFEKESVFFPFRPVTGHPMGLDSSGRDVRVQILYATRIALLFGIALVVVTMVVGMAVGAMQGYFAGRFDIIGQRFIEIWESLPFLYVMMLLGSVFGRSFFILLVAYGLFNWIGISYYIRGEFLKLRRLPFVESARVMGINRWTIMYRHVLPNALVPVITFFPFSLVGAIFSLAALDFLGFGLPPGTPSWGQLLSQGQEFQWAWWLILYPSIALFIVILLGVFVGEGIRNAFDPRSHSKLQ